MLTIFMATGTLLRELYEGESRRSVRFRYGLLLFDLLTIVFLALTSFVAGSPSLELIDAAIGLIVLGEFLARLSLSRRRFHDLLHPLGLADVAVIISFLAPVSGHGSASFARSGRFACFAPIGSRAE